ncbi:conserved hypothetical protein [Methanosalsum zhilinae DSM 4017]|uniref:Glycerophosphoryl diester phosphodiesterase membrane domain-containing protein n=1 Tax=Methanosalsum zhilinae (strain DSM 4017 / NBRC 107636 / OCM 62 / WeN5) TaxID=679901 RepID=F7XM86_METZD|nr:hypothetical protein [Methanosalsum zhilinae]AEH60975.1 conserved hypothetical protein [Methanosalsum zhilinae DSM 4017]
MTDDIVTVLNKGFSAWSRNLVISIPFILMTFISAVIGITYLVLFSLLVIIPSITHLSPEYIATMSPESFLEMAVTFLSDYLLLFIAGLVVTILIVYFIQAYFTAGAIGMIRQVAETGNTGLGEMSRSGREHVINLFLLNVLISLIMLAGIIFIIPGMRAIGDLTAFIADPLFFIENAYLLISGLFIWIIYAIIINVTLVMGEYILVIDRMDPISSLKAAFKFFMTNKIAVMVIWLVLVLISISMSVIGEVFGQIDPLAMLWGIISFVLSIAVIPPLTAIWWTFLYFIKNGRVVYDPRDLLSYSDRNYYDE